MTRPVTGLSSSKLSIGRLIRAPRATVFDAWLDENLIQAWMKPRPEVVVTEARTTPTVGGAFRIVMRANDRDEVHEGVYSIIDRPNRLSFSWVSASAGPDTNVDISFVAAADNDTMVLLKHERLASSGAAENHREGWRRLLDSLARVLEHAS